MSTIINKIFSLVWKHRLKGSFTKEPYIVIKVLNWRTALVDTPSGNRMRIKFCLFSQD